MGGFIYNISFLEIKKIYNVTGNFLFNNNVRYGLKNNKIGNEIGLNFKKYLSNCLYEKLDYVNQNSTVRDEIDNIYKEAELCVCKADLNLWKKFWFCHNGITIFSTEDIWRYGSSITVKPLNICVINGAQTLTNFFGAAEYIERELLKNILSIPGFKTIITMDSLLESIIVKTILIEGNINQVAQITNGLNTQIPIFEQTHLANSDDVKSINEYIGKEIKILKEGEEIGANIGCDLIDFEKMWLTITGKPGKSKNFDKKQLKKITIEIRKLIDENTSSKCIKQIKQLIEVNLWWDSFKKDVVRKEEYSAVSKIILSYGKNYFGSFVVSQINCDDRVYDEMLINLYFVFENIMLMLNSNLNVSDFKKDELFNKVINCIKNSTTNSSDSIELTSREKNELIKILNGENVSAYSFVKEISDYFNRIGKKITYFRVISMINGKCCEAFPFPRTTFSDLYENESKVDYENSSFKVAVNNVFKVFVAEKDINKKVIDIHYIDNFSFKEFEDKAKNVYISTIKSFNIGDEKRFIKVSDDMGFHIRPKALDSSDTFEFTNGSYITKRTFWANKKIVEKLIFETYKIPMKVSEIK